MGTRRIKTTAVYTVEETANILGLSYRAVLKHISSGNIMARKASAGAPYCVPGASIRAFLGLKEGVSP